MLKNKLRKQLRAIYDESDLKRWFDPLTLTSSLSGDVAVLFPHPLFSGWIDEEKRLKLKQILQSIQGPDTSIHFQSPLYGNYTSKNFNYPISLKNNTLSASNLFCHIDRSYHTFESFIFNKKNEFPLSLAMDSCNVVREKMHIPFVICGRGVCGKTHILRAMALSFSESLPNKQPNNVYLGDISSIIALFETEDSSRFRNTLLEYDAIFLDDMQESGKHSALQNELIHLLDRCQEQKKPLILVVEDISQSPLSAKLRSRIEGGMVITLKKPDMDIRLSYIHRLTHSLHISLTKDQELSLAQQLHDFRLIQGVINKLAAFIARRKPESGRKLDDIELASILEHNAPTSFQPVTPEVIISVVGERLGISSKDIAGNGRSQDTVLARQISMFLCRDILRLSFPSIGSIFGGKNHATVVYSCKKVQELRDGNSNMNKLVSSLRKKCASTTV